MKLQGAKQVHYDSGPNMTPLVDVVMVILIFLMLAGSFGAYLSPASAVRIGLVPRLALPRIVSAGNVAGEGAKIVALSHRERAEARSIVREVEYVELSGRADFNDLFVDELALPG